MQVEQAIPYVDQAEQINAPKSSEEFLEVHRGGCQDGVDRIPSSTLEPIELQPVFALQMPDAGFDRHDVSSIAIVVVRQNSIWYKNAMSFKFGSV